jgi:hypothetical protein
MTSMDGKIYTSEGHYVAYVRANAIYDTAAQHRPPNKDAIIGTTIS